MLNRENALKWVAALRSGDYEQTQGGLRDTLGYCCLGVACEVAIQSGVQIEVTEPPELVPQVSWKYNGMSGTLPLVVMDWLGVDDEFQEDCIGWNDSNEFDFDRIAENIESVIPPLPNTITVKSEGNAL